MKKLKLFLTSNIKDIFLLHFSIPMLNIEIVTSEKSELDLNLFVYLIVFNT